ncbi:MAG: DUF3841 domain-containing protein [Atopobiaceae bacterium]
MAATDAEGTDTLTLWTAQSDAVIEAIDRDGTSRVKMEYVNSKYGETAWIFKEAYSFFRETAPRYVPRPEGAESGVWCFVDPQWAYAAAGQTVLQLEVPRDEAVLFDLRMWNRMLNLHYLPKDRADEKRFNEELARQGIRKPEKIFTTGFYPLLKREILASWERLYTSAEGCDRRYLEAGLWELRREWIVSRVKFCGNLTLEEKDS